MVRNISKFVSLAAALVLFVCAGILFTGCSNSHNGNGGGNIIGVWKSNQSAADAEYYFCFASDSKFYEAYKKGGVLKSLKGVEYSVSGNKLKIGLGEYKYSITGDILKMEGHDGIVIYRRVSSPTEEEIKKAVE